MTILQAITIGLFISYFVISTILGNNVFLSLFWKLINYTKEKIYLKKLERINYFEYNDKTEKEEFIKIIINSFKYNPLWKENIQTLINSFTFKLDNRNYLVDFDNERLVIDKIGIIDKWSGLSINENAELNDFLKFATKLGLNIKISEINYLDKDENEFKIYLEINETKYALHQNYENEYFEKEIIYNFVNILNLELKKVKSKEKIYFINDYPTMIIFINDKIYRYLIKLLPIKDRPINPDEWKHIN